MSRYYPEHARELKRELLAYFDHAELRELHQLRPGRHFLIVARQILILVLAAAGAVYYTNPLIWIPLAVAMGFTIFNFTVLLHEVVHLAVFPSSRTNLWLNRVLGYFYAFPSGISASQFTKWHLDHHAELGSSTQDPKRFHLSPKQNKRWLKLLYFTPALFVIYFKAAAKETATYQLDMQKQIKRERLFTILFQFSLMGLSYLLGGAGVMLRVYVVPMFLVFPIAFALNRLGQHYNIRPEDPAQWSTLVRSSWFWNFWFLYSNLHLEHHYFPGVPFYNLPILQKRLQPFYSKRGMKAYGYGELLYRYIILNGTPHTDWQPAKSARAIPATA